MRSEEGAALRDANSNHNRLLLFSSGIPVTECPVYFVSCKPAALFGSAPLPAYDERLVELVVTACSSGSQRMDEQQTESRDKPSEFDKMADEQDPGLLAEFWDFLVHNKKWWLTPIILVLLLMGLLVILSGTAAAPFIYTLW